MSCGAFGCSTCGHVLARSHQDTSCAAAQVADTHDILRSTAGITAPKLRAGALNAPQAPSSFYGQGLGGDDPNGYGPGSSIAADAGGSGPAAADSDAGASQRRAKGQGRARAVRVPDAKGVLGCQVSLVMAMGS